jgi:hypothetical protein
MYFVGGAEWRFDVWAHNAEYQTNFYKNNPALKGSVVVHHAIEQQILKLYPRLFTKAELDAIKNLRGVPKELNSELHLSFIRRAWNRFYSNYPNASRADIEQYASILDSFVGSLFNPPV